MKIKLDIEKLTAIQYEVILEAFREQFGEGAYYDEWTIEARKTK